MRWFLGGFLACILAGAAMSIQGVMNTRLGGHIGTLETNAFVQCTAAVLSLPMDSELTDAEVERVADAVCRYFADNESRYHE